MPLYENRLQPASTDWLRLFLAPGILLVAAAVSLPIDMAIARFAKNVACPKLLVELLDRAETIGHFFGTALALTAVACWQTSSSCSC